ncbi:MAG TPA: glycosyltransferase [Candidatus Absconditabacterales bacterium]|nr:glycosyltransferase [Candidatus Absconditabacterales bacterium]
MTSRPIRIIALAGGSTGGHVVPLGSLARSIITQSIAGTLVRFGEYNSLEERESNIINNIYSTYHNSNQKLDHAIHFVPIVSGKFRRHPTFKELCLNIIDLFKFIRGVALSVRKLKQYQVDHVFSKGGFVSLPVVIAAWIVRIPITVHESDTKPGLSTRIASWFATTVFTGFPNVLPRAKVVGQILSDELIPDQNDLKHYNNNYTTCIINCGSLGSHSVHKAIIEIIKSRIGGDDNLKRHRIILLGKLNQGFKSSYEELIQQGHSIDLHEYVDQQTMKKLYIQSDLSICRGGTTTLVEQQLFGIKQIIIPIPRTHDQLTNAHHFVSAYGDILIKQTNTNRKQILDTTLKYYHDYHKQPLDIKTIYNTINQGKQHIIESLRNHGKQYHKN